MKAPTTKTDEWYTPKYIFDALDCRFDLDVAAPPAGPLHVPCSRHLSENALQRDWDGFVWMNPPFGGRRDKILWLNKFFEHGNGIALTPDRTSADWFRATWHKADRVLFLPRVSFLKPDGTPAGNPNSGVALWAAGNRASSILNVAANRLDAILAKPVKTRKY